MATNYDQAVEVRYSGLGGQLGNAIVNGKASLADLTAKVETANINPQPRSRRQVYFEKLINRFV